MTTYLRGFFVFFFLFDCENELFFLLSVGYLNIRHTCIITLIVFG